MALLHPSSICCCDLQAMAVCSRVAQGVWGPGAALDWGGRALNAPTALRCSVLRPHRQTRCFRCALYAQTMAMGQLLNALPAGSKPCAPQRPRGAPHPAPTRLGRRVFGGGGVVGARTAISLRRASALPAPKVGVTHTAFGASRQAVPGGGDFGGVPRSAGRGSVRASALRALTHRHCLSVESEANAASLAMRPAPEHRRSVGAFSARPRRREPSPGTACRDARQRRGSPTERQSQGVHTTGQRQTPPCPC